MNRFNYNPKPDSFYNIPDIIVGVSPCKDCGVEKWDQCFTKKKACDKLWDWLAKRGDLRMKYRKEILKE